MGRRGVGIGWFGQEEQHSVSVARVLLRSPDNWKQICKFMRSDLRGSGGVVVHVVIGVKGVVLAMDGENGNSIVGVGDRWGGGGGGGGIVLTGPVIKLLVHDIISRNKFCVLLQFI